MTEPLRILILEDDSADAELVQFELEGAEITFTAKVVMTEQDFIHEIETRSYDLILSDYDLPKYNGALALEEAKRRCPDIPFVLVTGAVSEDRAIQILTNGAKDYVMKNRLTRLAPAVQRVLAEANDVRARKKAEEELRAAHAELEAKVKERTAALEKEIDERKRAEEALRESERRYRELVQFAPVGIYEIDFRTGRLTSVNDAIVQVLGYSRDELLAMSALDVLDEESQIRFRDRIGRWLAGEKPNAGVEYRVRTRDGRAIDVLLSGSFIFDATGRAVGANVVAHDITERKRAEEALRENEDRYRGVVQNTTAIILRVAPSGVITFANRRALDFFGYSAEEIIGKHAVGTVVPPRESSGRDLATMVDKIAANPDAFHTNANENMCKDGRRVWMEWTNSGVYDSQGCLQEFLSVGIDTTDRKRAERDVERFNALMNCNPSLVFLKDESGKYVYLNKAYEEHFVGSKDWYGKTDSDFWPKESSELFRANDAEVLRSGQTAQFLEESTDLNGTRHCWLCYKFVFTDSQGQKYLGGIGIDATERVRVEEDLRASEERLEHANKELESFSYSVSHDLRAPLRAIDGYSRMILKKQGEKLDEETRQRLQMIKDNTARMGRLIDDLLALARLGSLAVTKKDLNIEKLVSEVWSELLAMHPGRKMTLKNGPMPMAWGDRSLIWQVYSNLLENAAKFTHGREGALIETGGFVQDGEMIYYVRDNGVGFDMRFYDKLFGVFQRLHSDEEYRGTGIGLALVKRIINRHGGRVWAEGEVAKGATFFFTLPTRKE